MNFDFDLKVESHVNEILSGLSGGIEAGLTAIGLAAEGHAKKNLKDSGAVDTGRLWNSVTNAVVMEEQAVYIGTNVEYAPYVELGTGLYAEGGGRNTPWSYRDQKGNWHTTRGMKPRPYLRPAITDHTAEYKSMMEEALKNGG